MSTKIHAACRDENQTVGLALAPGQAHDAPGFDTLYKQLDADNVLEAIAMDKAYDSDHIRERLETDGIEPVIPPKANRIAPPLYDKERYKQRNRVERFFNKLKQFRRIATRYDKLARTFGSALLVVATFIHLRSFVNTA